MRFFEYESRAIVAKAGIPVTQHGFAKTADEAARIAEQIAGPVVIKSQVLTGGRMKAGGVQFADTPEQAAVHADHVLNLEINGHMPRGVLVDHRAAVKHEYYAGVVWDGIRKQPVMWLREHIDPDDPYKTPYIAKPRGPSNLWSEWEDVMEPNIRKFYEKLDEQTVRAVEMVRAKRSQVSVPNK